MTGQISIKDYLDTVKHITYGGCGKCVCKQCLWYNSGRCPYGDCFDDKRMIEDPYNKAHPDKSPRTEWSDWNKPGEQEHWCRGGTFYPVYYCDRFVKYSGCQVKECLNSQVCVFQDGYMKCFIVDSIGCEECYRRFEERQKRKSFNRDS